MKILPVKREKRDGNEWKREAEERETATRKKYLVV